MSKKPLIIGITGAGQAGKDTFYQILRNLLFPTYHVKRYALADELKKDINPFLMGKCGVNIFDCTAEQKTLVRPLLVEYGRVKRIQSNGTYWTSIVEKQISKDKSDIICITDIRYAEYKDVDELDWLKKMGGVLVHISRYVVDTKTNIKWFIPVPNAEEARNDPILEKNADYRIQWPTADNEKENLPVNRIPHLLSYGEQFIEWAKENRHFGNLR